RYPAGYLPAGLPLRPGGRAPSPVLRQGLILSTRASGAERGIVHPESREVDPVEAAIPCQKGIGLHASVRNNKEIGGEPAAGRSLPYTVCPPEAASERRRFGPERVEPDPEHAEGIRAALVVREPCSHLGPYDRARYESAPMIGRAERLSGPHAEVGIGAQHVEKDRCVD